MGGDLISAIKDKQQRIVALRREIVALEAELREAKSLLGERPKREVIKVVHRKRPIRQKSSVWWAQKVLQHAGEPLHIDELVRRVEEFSDLTVQKTTLVSNLSRYVRARDTFTRPDEGLYGLVAFTEPQIEKGAEEGPLLDAGVAKR